MRLSTNKIRRPTRNLSTICCSGRRTASIGLGCGSIWRATPIAPATPTIRRETIWAYRDWVIKAINENMPFDQFTIEQIAGDLLPNPSEEQLIATAFHRNTMTNNEGGTQDEEFRNAAVVDRVNTTMAVWMGTTIACAQCHNHKYDPISQREYFQLFAILNNTQDADRTRRIAGAADLYRCSSGASRQNCTSAVAHCKRFSATPTNAFADTSCVSAQAAGGDHRDMKPTTTVPILRELTGQRRETRLAVSRQLSRQGAGGRTGFAGRISCCRGRRAARPPEPGALARRQEQSAHRARHRQSILGNAVWTRHRGDERGIRIARRAADSSRAVGLAGDGIHGQRLGHAGADSHDGHVGRVSPVEPDRRRRGRGRSGQSLVGSRAACAAERRDGPRPGTWPSADC